MSLLHWNASIANVQQNISSAKLLCVGPSLMYGEFSDDTRPGLQINSIPGKLAKYLSARYGIDTRNDSFFGDCNTTVGGIDITHYDPRIAIGSGWAGSPLMWENAAASTNPLSFTPSNQWDTADLYIEVGPSLAPFTWDIGGTVTPINPIVPDFGLQKVTISAGSIGLHTLNLRPSGFVNDVQINGISTYIAGNPTAFVHSFSNCGWAASDFANNPDNVWSPIQQLKQIAPDLTLIFFGSEELLVGQTSATFTANMGTIITAAQLTGDVVIIWNGQLDPSVVPATTQSAMQAAAHQIAQDNNFLIFDIQDRWTDFATAKANGYMACTLGVPGSAGDPAHMSGAGTGDAARALLQMLMEV